MPGWCSQATAVPRCSARPRTWSARSGTATGSGPEAAPAALGVDEAFAIDELDARLPRLLENRSTVWYPFATHKGLEIARRRLALGRCAPGCATARCVPKSSATCAGRSTRCGWSRTRTSRTSCAAPRRSAPAPTSARCSCRRACCARARTCASTTSTPSCCTNSASAARSTRPTARSSPPAPMPACCTTVPTRRRCATASWC